MTVNLTGAIWFWFLRAVAFCYILILIFHVGVPELITGLCWLGFFIFSFVIITGQNTPPAQ